MKKKNDIEKRWQKNLLEILGKKDNGLYRDW